MLIRLSLIISIQNYTSTNVSNLQARLRVAYNRYVPDLGGFFVSYRGIPWSCYTPLLLLGQPLRKHPKFHPSKLVMATRVRWRCGPWIALTTPFCLLLHCKNNHINPLPAVSPVTVAILHDS
ncbi:hypothetical protein M413DRAFT_338172 [Hebeloma cylindrosporum]|uniref:Uncharacterized protein n=1 Tax=Hebeloma cylindrosporum TaxID=76867 RepID=A0A0C3C903_HEBCY|nr:hypothetical protein M413DRAFT_338172 [Hebeloma cylindrosporum h7]